MASSIFDELPSSAQKSLSELHELINVAEQVTYDLAKSRSQVWKQVGIFAALALVAASMTIILISIRPDLYQLFPRGIVSAVGITYGIAVVLIYAVTVVSFAVNQRKWRLEREIVAEIIAIAAGILDSLQKTIGSVEYTLLKMRMRRLGLSEKRTFGSLWFN
ncbi:hypothetical protein SFC76_03175 [Sphingomonas sp. CD22]|uniref:hypothetical protein n=1 Tax=Sphingomonas sp. CD22 TaxID=3100214 RepID=UPI002ADF3805|nr:hypothetical protein [Sphingomonas sp. CD22]MEA1083251.1 hypothetical protein [Sphingomonas sp. CD22]